MEPLAVLLAIVLFGLPWLLVLALWLARRGGLRDDVVVDRARPRCRRCGYDLRKRLDSCRCPVCGMPFEVRASLRTLPPRGARAANSSKRSSL